MKVGVYRKTFSSDEDIRMYFTKFPLTDKVVFCRAGGSMLSPSDVEEGAPFAYGEENAFAECIMEVPGVFVVEVHPYHVVVRKYPHFEWEQIEGRLLRLFAAFAIDIENAARSQGGQNATA